MWNSTVVECVIYALLDDVCRNHLNSNRGTRDEKKNKIKMKNNIFSRPRSALGFFDQRLVYFSLLCCITTYIYTHNTTHFTYIDTHTLVCCAFVYTKIVTFDPHVPLVLPPRCNSLYKQLNQAHTSSHFSYIH